eukprot:7687614-Alexandrium_andersonii.AAC.1
MEFDLPEMREADIGGIDYDGDASLITYTTLPGEQGSCYEFLEFVCADDVPTVVQDMQRAT